MTHRSFYLTVTVVCCLLCADVPAAPPPHFVLPESTVASYWHNMAERQLLAALECFIDGVPDEPRDVLELPDLVELRCRDFIVHHRGRGVVDALYRIEYRISMDDPLSSFETGDRLCLTSRGWRIQAPLLFARR